MITQFLRLLGRLGSRKPDNHTSWVAVATPTDRPKSVRNRCLIEVFEGDFVLSHCFLDFSVSVWAFVIGLNLLFLFSESNVAVKVICLETKKKKPNQKLSRLLFRKHINRI